MSAEEEQQTVSAIEPEPRGKQIISMQIKTVMSAREIITEAGNKNRTGNQAQIKDSKFHLSKDRAIPGKNKIIIWSVPTRTGHAVIRITINRAAVRPGGADPVVAEEDDYLINIFSDPKVL